MSATINQKVEQLINLLKDYADKNGDDAFIADADPESNRFMDIVSNVEQWFKAGEPILYKSIKEQYKANKMRAPSIKDINIAFVDSNDYCISNTGNKYKLIPLNDNNRDMERRAHWQLLDTTIKDKEGRGLIVDNYIKQLVQKCKDAPRYRNIAKINVKKAVYDNPFKDFEADDEDENIELKLDDKDPTSIDTQQDMIDAKKKGVLKDNNKDNDETVAEMLENGEQDAPQNKQFM